jgi:hypothetical protein
VWFENFEHALKPNIGSERRLVKSGVRFFGVFEIPERQKDRTRLSSHMPGCGEGDFGGNGRERLVNIISG